MAVSCILIHSNSYYDSNSILCGSMDNCSDGVAFLVQRRQSMPMLCGGVGSYVSDSLRMRQINVVAHLNDREMYVARQAFVPHFDLTGTVT
jgi:hypothetical protein